MLSLLDLSRRIDAGDLTPAAAIDIAREAIAAREPEVGAFVRVDPAPALAQAGPLAGIAVGLKDIIEHRRHADRDGLADLRRLAPAGGRPGGGAAGALGAVPLAKTTTTPFAFMDPTATRNPHHPGHTPGGSSAARPPRSRPGCCR